MSLSVNNLYEFGDFRLNVREKHLVHGEDKIPLAPKIFAVLILLVENSGKLITKEELLNEVWAGSFVEESSLTFTVSQLRKILEDDSRKPKFIETIAKRGYRFIAEVKIKQDKVETIESLPKPVSPVSNVRKYRLPIIALIIGLITTVVFASWYVRKNNSQLISSILSDSMVSKQITDRGTSGSSAISPDGKFVIYPNMINGKSSLWRLQLDNSEKVQILPPTDDEYSISTISHDNEYVYFTRKRDRTVAYDIFRIPVFGGVPTKIINQTEGVFSLSPDDKQFSFVRCSHGNDDYCSLYIADNDGKNERKLITNPNPFLITDNQFSPDGKTVAFAHGQSFNFSKEFNLSEFDLASGEVHPILINQFFHIKNLKWLPDGQNFLAVGSRNAGESTSIWLIDRAGKIELISRNPNKYVSLSVSQDASKIVATEAHSDFKLYLAAVDNPDKFTALAESRGRVSFTPNGKIVYAAASSTNNNIWEMDADGNNQRQLTNDISVNYNPFVTPDGKFIFFTSSRAGSNQVWRMNSDGSNQLQITKTEGGSPLAISADGKMIYYKSSLNDNLWQVPFDGGEEKLLFEKVKQEFTFSPDSKRVAMFERSNGELMLKIFSVETKQVEKEYPMAEKNLSPDEALVWSPDGNFILYTAEYEGKNTFLFSQNLSLETPNKIADLESDYTVEIAISPDSKQFAFTHGRWNYDSVLITGAK